VTSPLHPFPLGPDTVDLIVRTPLLDGNGDPQLDPYGIPLTTAAVVTKTQCSFREQAGHEQIQGGSTIATLDGDAHLPVDADTLALDIGDAMRHNGRLFELQTPGVLHDDQQGFPSHVRALGRWSAGGG
jgi:hypothetical protein